MAEKRSVLEVESNVSKKGKIEPLFPPSDDLLVNYALRYLFQEDKTIRDPIHGDVILNRAEVSVIDSPIFLRLREIKCLGPTYLVFPGAEHSRFQHSIGTLYMANCILDSINKNPYPFRKIDYFYDRMIIRLLALIHDLPNIAFSHTLEKEGNLYPPQWEDIEFVNKIVENLIKCLRDRVFKSFDEEDDRIRRVLGDLRRDLGIVKEEEVEGYIKGIQSLGKEKKEEIADRVSRLIVSDLLRIISKTVSTNKMKDILRIAENVAKSVEGQPIRRFPEDLMLAAAMIVMNTICADLLDYIKRDLYFCGVKGEYDDFFLKYAVIVPTDREGVEVVPAGNGNECILAYRITKPITKEVKTSVISSILNLLDLRCNLAEIVHFHHTKLSLSAMIIEAVNFALREGDENLKKKLKEILTEGGDIDLLHFLEGEKEPKTKEEPKIKIPEPSKKLVLYYKQRKVYKRIPLFEWNTLMGENWINQKVPLKQGEAVLEALRDPESRYQFEIRLPEWSKNYGFKNFEKGDILIYVPPRAEKLYKELNAYVFIDRSRHMSKSYCTTLLELANGLGEKSLGAISQTVRDRRDALLQRYGLLWKSYIMINPDKFPRDPEEQERLGGLLKALLAVLLRAALVEKASQKVHHLEFPDDAIAYVDQLLYGTKGIVSSNDIQKFEENLKKYIESEVDRPPKIWDHISKEKMEIGT
jgi:HD superfamily phosphohydrolase